MYFIMLILTSFYFAHFNDKCFLSLKTFEKLPFSPGTFEQNISNDLIGHTSKKSSVFANESDELFVGAS